MRTEPWEWLDVGVREQGAGTEVLNFLPRAPVGGAVSQNPKGISLGVL